MPNLQENTCTGVSVLKKSQKKDWKLKDCNLKNETPAQAFSYNFCETFQNISKGCFWISITWSVRTIISFLKLKCSFKKQNQPSWVVKQLYWNHTSTWGCFPVNLLHIFGTPFAKNTSGRLLLKQVLRRVPSLGISKKICGKIAWKVNVWKGEIWNFLKMISFIETSQKLLAKQLFSGHS